MTRWSRPKSETPSARHTLARDAYAIHYGHIKDIAQALDNDQFDWLCASTAKINCESIAEYLTELVRDQYEEAKGCAMGDAYSHSPICAKTDTI